MFVTCNLYLLQHNFDRLSCKPGSGILGKPLPQGDTTTHEVADTLVAKSKEAKIKCIEASSSLQQCGAAAHDCMLVLLY
jgi:hypothetical protein